MWSSSSSKIPLSPDTKSLVFGTPLWASYLNRRKTMVLGVGSWRFREQYQDFPLSSSKLFDVVLLFCPQNLGIWGQSAF